MEQHKKNNPYYRDYRKELQELLIPGRQRLERYWEAHEEEIYKAFASIINTLIHQRGAGLRHLIFSPLCASFITREYSCLAAAYDERIYLDVNAVYEEFTIPGVREIVQEDIKQFVQEGESRDIAVENDQTFQLEFDYACMYFTVLKKLFQKLVADFKETQGMKVGNMDFSFGWYMERTEILGGERP